MPSANHKNMLNSCQSFSCADGNGFPRRLAGLDLNSTGGAHSFPPPPKPHRACTPKGRPDFTNLLATLLTCLYCTQRTGQCTLLNFRFFLWPVLLLYISERTFHPSSLKRICTDGGGRRWQRIAFGRTGGCLIFEKENYGQSDKNAS